MYVQTFLAWVLLFFDEADDLVDGTYRTAGLTVYAIAFALALTDGSHSSVQTDIVLHSFVMILIFSLFAMMAFRTFLRGRMYVISLLGTLPLAIWLFYLAIKEIKDKQCYEFTVVSRAAKSYTPLFIIFWAVSLSLYIFALPCFSLLFFNKTRTRVARMPLKLVPMGIWFVTWFFMVVACEVATHSFQFRELDYQLTPLTAQEWQFGQVIAVVMLFLRLYDVCTYPFRESKHGGKRISYWWAYRFKPFWNRCISWLLRVADGRCEEG